MQTALLFAVSLGAVVPLIRKLASLASAPDASETEQHEDDDPSPRQWRRWLLPVCILCGIAAYVCIAIAHPYGDWDGLMIWNLHAAFMDRGGAVWKVMFAPELFWSHPDYPLLVPTLVAAGWRLIGSESAVIPIMVASTFIIGCLGMLWVSLRLLGTERLIANLAVAILVSTPFFLVTSAWQYADIPFSFYLLALCVCLLFYQRNGHLVWMQLGGLSAGFCVWTKNEGWLILVALVIARLVAVWRKGDFQVVARDLFNLLCGAALPLSVALYFKTALAPCNDILAGLSQHTILAACDPSRLGLVIVSFAISFITFGHWCVSPVPFLAWMSLSAKPGRCATLAPALSTIGMTLVLSLIGYFCIYLILPGDNAAVSQRLQTSLDRLLLQLFPATLLWFTLGTPGLARLNLLSPSKAKI